VRPQSHEIIRTWAFYTIAQSLLHEGSVPWTNVLVSGWVRDPDRKKMSKSAGNVIAPESWIDRYSADAVRYWAAGARLGVDTTFDEGALDVGARLATKLFHAARFVHGWHEAAGDARPTRELDLAFMAELREVVRAATASLEAFDHVGALAATERCFRSGLTDNYIELVKVRLRGDDGASAASAAATLQRALRVIVRLFAPFLPFVTEEIWSWEAAAATGHPSVHRAPWPDPGELDDVARPMDPGAFALAVTAIGAVRRFKTDAKVSVGAPVSRLVLAGAGETIAGVEPVVQDVAGAARAAELVLRVDRSIPPGEFAVREARWAEAGSG
jgi:valyl-tRNA synthetase